MLGDRIEGALGEELDPRLREMLGEQLEDSLEDRLDSDARDWLTEANQMIARRIAEHHAHDMTFRRPRFR